MPEDKAAKELFEKLNSEIKKVQDQFPLALMIRSEQKGKDTLLQYIKNMLDEKGIKYIDSETDSYKTIAIVVEQVPVIFSQTFNVEGEKNARSNSRSSKGPRNKRARK